MIRIGTRGSRLALTQTGAVREMLARFHPETEFELVTIKTTGDVRQDRPFQELGQKGVFTKELDDALREMRIDVAVHSLKDVTSEFSPDIRLGAITKSEDVRDVLVSTKGTGFRDLPQHSRVGTSSLRRRALLLSERPDLQIFPIRGNVETRIEKMKSEGLDAILLAAAGMKRLGLGHLITEFLDPTVFVPSPGQGRLAITCRSTDDRALELLTPLNETDAWPLVRAERKFMILMEGGCEVPLGCLANVEGRKLNLSAFFSDPDGRHAVRKRVGGSCEEPERVAEELADWMRENATEAWRALRTKRLKSETSRKVIITRSREGNADFGKFLKSEGMSVVSVDASITTPISDSETVSKLRDTIADYQGIVFTSANAVHYFAERLKDAGIEIAQLMSPFLAAVGERTAMTVESVFGRKPSVPPNASTAYELAEYLGKEIVRPGMRLLFPRAKAGKDTLVDYFGKRNVVVDVMAVYDTVINPKAKESAMNVVKEGADWIIFASGSAVDHFVDLVGGLETFRKWINRFGVRIAVLGRVTSARLEELGLAPDVTAAKPDLESLRTGLKNYDERRQ